jgi:hypothetical protein
VAIVYMAEFYEIPLTATRLPKHVRQTKALRKFWQALDSSISPGRVAVLGLGGRDSHWTVAVGVTAHQIRLFDSGRLSVLRRSQCAVGKVGAGYAIPPSQVLIIGRGEV